MPGKRGATSGMTLVEMMVALAIAAVLVLGATRLMDSGTQAALSDETQAAVNRDMDLALDGVAQELSRMKVFGDPTPTAFSGCTAANPPRHCRSLSFAVIKTASIPPLTANTRFQTRCEPIPARLSAFAASLDLRCPGSATRICGVNQRPNVEITRSGRTQSLIRTGARTREGALAIGLCFSANNPGRPKWVDATVVAAYRGPSDRVVTATRRRLVAPEYMFERTP